MCNWNPQRKGKGATEKNNWRTNNQLFFKCYENYQSTDSSRRNRKEITLRYIVMKFLKITDKGKNLESAREGRYNAKRGTKRRMATDFSSEGVQARRQLLYCKVIKVGKKTLLAQNAIPSKVSFKNKSKIKTFSEMQKQKDFNTSRIALQTML